MPDSHEISLDSIGSATSAELALLQVAELVRSAGVTEVSVVFGGRSFESGGLKAAKRGLLAASGRIAEDLIVLRLELLRAADGVRVDVGALFEHLWKMGDRCLLVPPVEAVAGRRSLWVELKVQATPLSVMRSNALLSQLEVLHALACTLQEAVPAPLGHEALLALYAPVAQHMSPVLPLEPDSAAIPSHLEAWALRTLSLMLGAASVALQSTVNLVTEASLSLLARAGNTMGRTFGRVKAPHLNERVLLELAEQAPGTLVVPAVSISLGTSPYELSGQMAGLQDALSAAGTPVVFTGSRTHLELLFHGGQGGESDPARPVITHPPVFALELLARFGVSRSAARAGGLAPAIQQELVRQVLQTLAQRPEQEQLRLLEPLIQRAVQLHCSGQPHGLEPAAEYVEQVCSLSETLSGLAARPRSRRSQTVSQHFTRTLSSPALLAYFGEHLLGQDHALGELVSRLRTESLTRPENQPLRYCVQGTPGTGKSASTELLARRLELPLVNIDAASMPDYHTAASQLLGSGRGIVNSYQSGRLERAAKHHRGVVVEVSDLDHAPPGVRAFLADLFLQVLETGEAQSAIGNMFSCANAIFVFTLNLPGGLDEAVYRSVGYTGSSGPDEVRARVSGAIKQMLSSAFLSRVGSPILFAPLERDALEQIAERAVLDALLIAAERLGVPDGRFELGEGVGQSLVSALGRGIAAAGARELVERGRQAAATALSRLLIDVTPAGLTGSTVVVSASEGGELMLSVRSNG